MARKISKALLATFLSLSAFTSNNHTGAMEDMEIQYSDINNEALNNELEHQKYLNEFKFKFGYNPEQRVTKTTAFIIALASLIVGSTAGFIAGRVTKKVPSGRSQEIKLK